MTTVLTILYLISIVMAFVIIAPVKIYQEYLERKDWSKIQSQHVHACFIEALCASLIWPVYLIFKYIGAKINKFSIFIIKVLEEADKKSQTER